MVTCPSKPRRREHYLGIIYTGTLAGNKPIHKELSSGNLLKIQTGIIKIIRTM